MNIDPFLTALRNFGFMLNIDWFQPFKHSLYSVGALYMVLMNLPRSQRFKLENVFLVGVIPGPHEPNLNIPAASCCRVEQNVERWCQKRMVLQQLKYFMLHFFAWDAMSQQQEKSVGSPDMLQKEG